MGDKHGIRLSEKDFGCINQRMRLLSLFLRRSCKQWSLWRESQVKLMKTTLVTIKQCSNPAEAAFFASYLEDNGVHTVNSAENMGAWTGRYSLLTRGPVLRVHVRDMKKARALLANPPKPLEEDMELAYSPATPEFVSGESLTKCPLCGAENIVAVSGNNALVWLLSLLSFGLYEPAANPMWVCRNCDWDSHRRMGE